MFKLLTLMKSNFNDEVGVLLRFFSDLNLVRKLVIPTFALTLIGSLLPVVFLFFIGKAAGCNITSDCVWRATLWNIEFHIELHSTFFIALFFVTLFIKMLSLSGFELVGLWSTTNIYKQIIKSLNDTKVSFFDLNPSGKLINRIVSDFSYIQIRGVSFIADAFFAFTELLCISVIIALVNPISSLAIIPVIVFYIYFQRNMAPILSKLASLASDNRGEFMNREIDLVEGREIYFRYQKEKWIAHHICEKYRKVVNVALLDHRITCWGFFWMTLASVLFTVFVYGFLMVGVSRGVVSSPMAGIVITLLLTLDATVLWLAMTTTNLTSSISIMKRIYELIDLAKEEADEFSESYQLTTESSNKTDPKICIQIEDFSMSYREDTPIVLNHLNILVKRGEHIGIVGETGSGKSSIFQSLLRMVNVHTGDILINGQSIYQQDIVVVREMFGVVGQRAQIFSGSLRYNLIFSNEKSHDHMLIPILSSIGLDYDLNTKIEKNGNNLSEGEKQLISIARVAYKDNPILLMDEPTSLVGSISEKKIQNLILNQFRNKTIVTISHKKSSLKNCDRIFGFVNGHLSEIKY